MEMKTKNSNTKYLEERENLEFYLDRENILHDYESVSFFEKMRSSHNMITASNNGLEMICGASSAIASQ